MLIYSRLLCSIKNRFFTKGNILLIQAPPWDVSMPPLGIAYLASYLEKHGFNAFPVDLNIMLYHSVDKKDKYLWEQKSYNFWADDSLYKTTLSSISESLERCVNGILDMYDADYIGLSVNFAGIKITSDIIRLIKSKKNNAKIILGGWGCVNSHMRSLFPGDLVDVFVVGEGEQTLLEVMKALKGNSRQRVIPGAVFGNNEDLREKREPIGDLDSIPWPKYKNFDLSLYTSKAIPLFASRGCIGHCAFCNDWALSKPYRARSAVNVFKEIEYHVRHHNVNYFSFKDLLCNGDIGELNGLCEKIIKSGLSICWDSQAIPYSAMTPEVLRNLKASGCGSLIYGVENFSNNVLKGMKKIFTKEAAEKVLKDTREAGIDTCVNIIVGFPGETDSDFKENLDALKRNQKYITHIGAVSVCLVNNDNDLDINYNKYNIVLPEDPAIRAKKWHTADYSNTYEIRRARAERMLELIKELKLSYATVTL